MWNTAENIFLSLIKHNTYIIIFLLLILLISFIFPVTTSTAFQSLFELLPNFIKKYFNNISLTNSDIFSIFQFTSIMHILSVLLLLLSSWKMNFFKECLAIYGFLVIVNIYFILILFILYNNNITTLNLISYLFEEVNWYNFFSIANFGLICLYILNILLQFVTDEN